MKKIFSILIILSFMLLYGGCQNNSKEKNNPPSNSTDQSVIEQPAKTDTKSLIVYFSWSGNTKNLAQTIQSQTNADIFEIEAVVPYGDDYDTVVDLAQEEQRADARPAITNQIENINEYDVIYVGYPNWWGDMPMILYSFFDNYDLSNKTIAPFCTSGGSGLSNTVNEIKNLEPNAAVTNGLHIGSSSVNNSDNNIRQWLQEINLGS